jgi:acetyltransferase-like isoleucine patch superfamily enzyme
LSIKIGDNVKIGGGARIYDTDFHSIDPELRINPKTDFINKQKLEVVIEDNVFIGAHATILKGVCIGKNSIIGASSVVTKNIPANEIWAGNPAKFIRNV